MRASPCILPNKYVNAAPRSRSATWMANQQSQSDEWFVISRSLACYLNRAAPVLRCVLVVDPIGTLKHQAALVLNVVRIRENLCNQ